MENWLKNQEPEIARDYFNDINSFLILFKVYKNDETAMPLKTILEKLLEYKKDGKILSPDEYLKNNKIKNFPDNLKQKMQKWYKHLNSIKDEVSLLNFFKAYENYNPSSDDTPDFKGF